MILSEAVMYISHFRFRIIAGVLAAAIILIVAGIGLVPRLLDKIDRNGMIGATPSATGGADCPKEASQPGPGEIPCPLIPKELVDRIAHRAAQFVADNVVTSIPELRRTGRVVHESATQLDLDIENNKDQMKRCYHLSLDKVGQIQEGSYVTFEESAENRISVSFWAGGGIRALQGRFPEYTMDCTIMYHQTGHIGLLIIGAAGSPGEPTWTVCDRNGKPQRSFNVAPQNKEAPSQP